MASPAMAAGAGFMVASLVAGTWTAATGLDVSGRQRINPDGCALSQSGGWNVRRRPYKDS